MTSSPPILGSFVDRLAVRDFGGLAACLDPDVRLRAIIPPGPEEHQGRAAAAGRFRDWFADVVSFELVKQRDRAIRRSVARDVPDRPPRGRDQGECEPRRDHS